MDGIYLINKPENITSYDCIRVLKKVLNNKKIGHAGTLDPFASGLLVVLVGQMTKLSSFLMDQDKAYEGVITFGYATDTFDNDGTITEKKDAFNLTFKEVKETLDRFTGPIKQKPPIYSALKVDGKKLYQYAREKKDVEILSRETFIHILTPKTFDGIDLTFYSKVEKGTYIRSLANDIGKSLQIPAHLSKLKRLSSGDFNLKDAYDLDKINETTKPTITIYDYAKDLKKITVKPYLEPLIKNGVLLDHRQTDLKEIFSVYNEKDELLAIYQPTNDRYKPLIILKDSYDEN